MAPSTERIQYRRYNDPTHTRIFPRMPWCESQTPTAPLCLTGSWPTTTSPTCLGGTPDLLSPAGQTTPPPRIFWPGTTVLRNGPGLVWWRRRGLTMGCRLSWLTGRLSDLVNPSAIVSPHASSIHALLFVIILYTHWAFGKVRHLAHWGI